MGYLYLLHLDRPLSGKHASHYLGYSDGKPDKRIKAHERGGRDGSAFTREAKRQGIRFVVAGIWSNMTQADERHVKRMKRHRDYCAVCRAGLPLREMPPVPRNALKSPMVASTAKNGVESIPGKGRQNGTLYGDPDDLEDLPY